MDVKKAAPDIRARFFRLLNFDNIIMEMAIWFVWYKVFGKYK